MVSVVAISGSPSSRSKTAVLVDRLLGEMASASHTTEHIRLSSIPASALLTADMTDPALRKAVDAVAGADGVIIATPVFKAAYSGLLKCFLDVLPQFGLQKKAVLPLATGGSVAHVLAIDYALRPVVQSMGVRHAVQGVFVPEASLRLEDDSAILGPEVQALYDRAMNEFMDALALGRPGERTGRTHEAVAA